MQEHIYNTMVDPSELERLDEITQLYNLIGNRSFEYPLPGGETELRLLRGNAHVLADLFEGLFSSCTAHHGMSCRKSHAWLTNSNGHIIDILPVGAISPPILVYDVANSNYDRSITTEVSWRKSPEYEKLIKELVIEYAPFLGRSPIE